MNPVNCLSAVVLALAVGLPVPTPPVPSKVPPPAASFLHPFRPAPRPPVVPVPPAPADRTAWAADMLARHNTARAQAGRSPLALDDRLSAAAQGQAEDCARRDVLSHFGWDSSSPWDRIRRAGYPRPIDPKNPQEVIPFAAGENAASGWPDTPPSFPGSAYGPAQAFSSLMGDPPHRANVLGGWTHLGVGLAVARNGRRYVVIDYARP